MLTPESRLAHAAGLLTSEIDGETVMMDVEAGSYLNLDAIGTEVWNRIGAGISFAELCAAMEASYDADADTIARDVAAFVEEMVSRGLVRVDR